MVRVPAAWPHAYTDPAWGRRHHQRVCDRVYPVHVRCRPAARRGPDCQGRRLRRRRRRDRDRVVLRRVLRRASPAGREGHRHHHRRAGSAPVGDRRRPLPGRPWPAGPGAGHVDPPHRGGYRRRRRPDRHPSRPRPGAAVALAGCHHPVPAVRRRAGRHRPDQVRPTWPAAATMGGLRAVLRLHCRGPDRRRAHTQPQGCLSRIRGTNCTG